MKVLVAGLSGGGIIGIDEEPGHQDLCDIRQAFVIKAINNDLDLTRQMNDAVQSLEICLASDQSIRSGLPVNLGALT